MRALVLSFAMLLFASAALAIDPTQLSDPALQVRYRELSHELRCLKCQNEAIADSPSDVAEDLRRELRELLVAGKTDDEIRDFMVARYGEFILFRPRMSPRNYWLWFGPAILLVGGALIAVRVVRQRSRLVADDDQPIEEEAGR
jgi:cytochrome c-type biogenesis protein CcmH